MRFNFFKAWNDDSQQKQKQQALELDLTSKTHTRTCDRNEKKKHKWSACILRNIQYNKAMTKGIAKFFV